MDRLRDLPCERVELDEQWQYVGCHKGRMSAPESGKGDFWLWAAVDSDTKLVFSHRIGKRDWITGNMFVEDVSNRVSGPVQIAPQTIFRLIRFILGNTLDMKDMLTTRKQRFSANPD
jgi:hypothetical protein